MPKLAGISVKRAKKEVMKMVDMSNAAIEKIFFQQIRRLTVPGGSFDAQSGGRWLR